MALFRRLLVLFVLAIGASGADAASALTTPPLLVDGSVDAQFSEPDASALAVGAADSGDAVAAWRDAGAGVSGVVLATWPAGAAAPSVQRPGLGGKPDVGMSPGGVAIASWVSSDGALRIARRTPGGGFSAPSAYDPPPPTSGSPNAYGPPAVALRPDGSAVVGVPRCRFFGSHADLDAVVFNVAADGAITGPEATTASITAMDLCTGTTPNGLRVRAVAGPSGRAAVAACPPNYCQLATRAAAGAGWTAYGMDGVNYAGSQNAEGTPVITPQGKVVSAWRDLDPAPVRVQAAVGPTATAMVQLGNASNATKASSAPILAAMATDALAVWSTDTAGGQRLVARPIFAGGSYGAAADVAPLVTQSPDPSVATWPDGSGVIAYAARPTAGDTSSLALVRRTLGGALSPIAITPLPGRSVTLPRVALAGDGGAPLGLAATREAPPAGPATVVLRRIDGIAPTLAAAVPASAAAGSPVALSATATDVSVPISVRWDFGDGTSATGPSVNHAFATVGARTVTATATDAAGNATTAAAAITIQAPRVVPVGFPPAPPSVRTDAVAPVIRAARLSPSRFLPTAGGPKPNKRRLPSSATLRLTLSEAATLRLTVVRVRTGRRSRGLCRLAARKGSRCTRRTKVGSIRRSLRSGSAKIAFSGRLVGRRLARGRYELTLVATDAAGNKSRTRTLQFRIG